MPDRYTNVNCYCDPGSEFPETITNTWKDICYVSGCRALAWVFLLLYSFIVVGCGYRMWKLRARKSSTLFVSVTFLFLSCIIMATHQLMMVFKLKNVIALAGTLVYTFSLYYCSFLTLLMTWCDILRALRNDKRTTLILCITKKIFVFLCIAILIVFGIALVVWYPYWVSNNIFGVYGVIVVIGYITLTIILQREYKKLIGNGKPIKEVKEKMELLKKTAIAIVITTFIMTVIMFSFSYWIPKSGKEYVAWLFVTRSLYSLIAISFLSALSTTIHQDKPIPGKSNVVIYTINSSKFTNHIVSSTAVDPFVTVIHNDGEVEVITESRSNISSDVSTDGNTTPSLKSMNNNKNNGDSNV